MVQQTVTVTLPEDFYQRVKVRAERAHHSVEEELLKERGEDIASLLDAS